MIDEDQLRRARREPATRALREEPIRYYEAGGDDERAEDEATARALAGKARNVRYD